MFIIPVSEVFSTQRRRIWRNSCLVDTKVLFEFPYCLSSLNKTLRIQTHELCWKRLITFVSESQDNISFHKRRMCWMSCRNVCQSWCVAKLATSSRLTHVFEKPMLHVRTLMDSEISTLRRDPNVLDVAYQRVVWVSVRNVRSASRLLFS